MLTGARQPIGCQTARLPETTPNATFSVSFDHRFDRGNYELPRSNKRRQINEKGNSRERGKLQKIFRRAREADELLSVGGLSVREAADRLGVSIATVSYRASYVRRLPGKFVAWLESGQCDDFQHVLLERRLRELAKLHGAAQMTAITELLQSCAQNADASQVAVLRELEHEFRC